MRSLRYLNGVLTILAVLLTLNLWTLWTAPMAPAQSPVDFATEAHGQSIPNAAAQRVEIINQLKSLNGSMNELKNLFTSGKARVIVTEGNKN